MFSRQAVKVLRLHVRDQLERCLKFLPTSALGAGIEIFLRQKCGHFLGDGGADELINRGAFLLGTFSKLLVQRVGKSDAEGTHPMPPISSKNSAGLKTRTP